MKKILSILLLLGIGWYTSIHAQTIPQKTNHLVNDFSGLLKEEEVKLLENFLIDYEDSTSNEIVIVTVSSLEGDDINSFGQKLGEQWGIGKSNKDNGVLILIAPNERKISIQTGYGLEGVLPDALCKRIIEKEIKPFFKRENYFEGIQQGVGAIIASIKGEYTADKKTARQKFSMITFLIVIGVFILYILITRKYKGGGGTMIGGGAGIPWWMMNSGGGRSSGSWGDFSSGKGSFGGFGGGSFGGGGASGSW